MKAIILAAGEGTRMRPLTLENPKPLLSLGDKKIIDHVIDSLPDEIDEIILIVEYLKEKIIDYINKKYPNKKIKFITQGNQKGTFGALLSARDSLNPEERFLVLNSDDLHDKEELKKYLDFPCSFGIQKMIMPNYYNIEIDSEGFVLGFQKQNEAQKISGAMIGTGVYVLDPHIFEHPGIIVYGGELGLPQTILAQKDLYPIKAIITEKWKPINTISDLEKARKK